MRLTFNANLYNTKVSSFEKQFYTKTSLFLEKNNHPLSTDEMNENRYIAESFKPQTSFKNNSVITKVITITMKLDAVTIV